MLSTGKMPSYFLGNSGVRTLLTEETDIEKIFTKIKTDSNKQDFENLAAEYTAAG